MRVSLGLLERVTWVFSLCTLLALGYLVTPQPSFAWQEGPLCSVAGCETEGEEAQEACDKSFSECGPFQYQISCACGPPEVGAYCECL